MYILHTNVHCCSCFRLHLKKLKYLGTVMNIEITQQKVLLTVLETGDYELVLRRNDSSNSVEESLTQGENIVKQ